MRRWIMLAILALVSCKGGESELRTKADWLCRYNQLQSLTIEGLPDSANIGEYVRAEDLEHVKAKDQEVTGGLLGQLATTMKATLTPVLKAATEAMEPHTKCEILSVEVREAEATVTVKVTKPDIGLDGGLARLGEVAKLDGHDAKVKKFEEWIAASKGDQTAELTLQFVKTPQGWRANYHLPEDAAQAERAKGLHEEAVKLSKDYDLTGAKTKLEEALRIAPNDEGIKKDLDTVTASLSKIVAGKWFMETAKDPMTDDTNVTVYLPADAEIQKSYGTARPMLYARCSERKLDMFVHVDAMVESDWREGVKCRYRFDEEKAVPFSMNDAKGSEAVFFRQTKEWLDRLMAHPGSKFILEVPLYRGSAVATFSLDGADTALAKVKTACSL